MESSASAPERFPSADKGLRFPDSSASLESATASGEGPCASWGLEAPAPRLLRLSRSRAPARKIPTCSFGAQARIELLEAGYEVTCLSAEIDWTGPATHRVLRTGETMASDDLIGAANL